MRGWFSQHYKLVTAAALALVCAGLGAALLRPASRQGAALTRASYDSYFAWFDLAVGPPRDAPVIIVYLDLESFQTLHQNPTQPWPRELYAQLLQRLAAAGARAVAFDVVFDSPGTNPSADDLLRQAIIQHGRVVLAGELTSTTQQTGPGTWSRTMQLASPIESFRNAAAGWGLGNIDVDDDFVARRHWPGRELDGEMRWSLTWAASRTLGIDSTAALEPVQPSRWLRYYGPPLALPHVSLSSALRAADIPDALFRDRVVLVGARPMSGLFKERRDEFRSPFDSWHRSDQFMPGVEVHATQMLNLLRHDWLTRLPVSTEFLILILFGALVGAGLLWLRPVPATVASVIVAASVIMVAAVLFRQAGIWFPWLIAAGAQIPLALGGSVLFHSLDWYQTRRRLEGAKRAAEARIRQQAALIEKAQDAILVQTLEGRITYANPSAERLYGWTLAELSNGQAQALFGDAAVQAARATTLAGGEWSGQLQQPTRAGKTIIVESRWTLLRDEAGQPQGLLVINSDVTEKKQLEAESLRMQRMEAIGALAGGMAHDLNNALAPVLMGTQLLRRDAKDENARRILSLMESSMRRGAEMVRQVLLFARGKEGDFEPLDARPLVKEVEKLARDTFPPSIAISAHTADDLWPLRGNATQLHQVLLNLCVNARDAMPEGGSLALAADNVDLSDLEARAIPEGRPGAFIVFLVSDTGAGIPPDVLPRIFEPFFTTKSEGKGTGLGLSTTARIVKAHGGFIHVTSSVGEGTTFEIYLPRLSLRETEPALEATTPPPRGHGELILLADDDEAVCELLRRSLEEYGYHTAVAANGAEVVSLFKRDPRGVSLLITDQAMPVLDGTKAVQAIREIRSDLPVLFLSGEADVGHADQKDSHAPTIHLPKPVDLDSLLRAVSRLIGNPES